MNRDGEGLLESSRRQMWDLDWVEVGVGLTQGKRREKAFELAGTVGTLCGSLLGLIPVRLSRQGWRQVKITALRELSSRVGVRPAQGDIAAGLSRSRTPE